jgi:colanic acid biosynthesis glycosyl transferase WcaI
LGLSIELSQRGHDVLHVFSKASGGPKASFEKKSLKNLKLAGISVKSVEKDNLLKRWVQERHYGDMAIRELKKWRPDVLISANTPLEAQKQILYWAKRHKVPSIYWLHDLLSIAAYSILSKVNRILG